MNHFCTYCDQGYAARLLCLYRSLRAQPEPFQLFVLCFDGVTERVVAAERDPAFVAIPAADLLAADAAYAAASGTRSRIEFYFTTTPVLVRHCLGRAPAAPIMTYLDADLWFFGSPAAVLIELGAASIGIVPHRFPERLAALRRFGAYNVAWVSFRRDPNGLAAVEWWRERCLEWCQDQPDGGRYADQGYLDEFPRRFAGVRVLDDPGINAAPWNMEGARLALQDGERRVNDRPLRFFHFQGIRELMPGWYDPGLKTYGVPLDPALRELVYEPYLRRLAAEQHRLAREFGVRPQLGFQRLATGNLRQRLEARVLGGWIMPWYRRLAGKLIHCPPDGAH